MRNVFGGRTLVRRARACAILGVLVAGLVVGVSSASAEVAVSSWWGAPSWSVVSIASSNPFGGTSIARNSGDNKYTFTVKNGKAPAEGETLVCNTGEWANTPTGFTYQWLRNGVAISGATGGTYTLAAADKGEAVQCQVAATNASADTAVLALTPVQIAPAPATEIPVATGRPSLSGTEAEGNELTCPTGTWTGGPSFARQWLRNGVAISGATGEKYLLASADKGTVVQCQVSASNAGGSTVVDSSTKVISTAPPVAPPAPPSTIPSLTGVVANVGEKMTCGAGEWYSSVFDESNTPFAYQWSRDGVAISGASTNEYILAAADKGQAIQCEVTATKPGPDSEMAVTTAVLVGAVPATTPPALSTAPELSGTTEEGHELTCSTGVWSGVPTIARQWLRNGVAITGATGETYKLGGLLGNSGEDNGKAIQCKIIATNAGGSVIALTARDVIQPEPTNPGVPSIVVGPKLGVAKMVVKDVLPTGMTLGYPENANAMVPPTGWSCSVTTVSCARTEVMAPGAAATFTLAVRAGSSTPAVANNEVVASGGGALSSAALTYPTTITAAVPFGIASFWANVTNEFGTPFTQSTGHPFEASTQFILNSTTNEKGELVTAGGEAKNIEVELPPGFIGSPDLRPRCTVTQFEGKKCPAETAVGIVYVRKTRPISEGFGRLLGKTPTFTDSINETLVYNLLPPPGSPAAFGFLINNGIQFYLTAKVRSDGNYGVTVASINTPPQTAPPVESEFTFCANGAKVETVQLGTERWACKAATPGSASFVTNPAQCTGTAPQTTLRVNSWERPKTYVSKTIYTGIGGGVLAGEPSGLESFVTNCEGTVFKPTIQPVPDSTRADSPTGMSVDLKVPQQLTVPAINNGEAVKCISGGWSENLKALGTYKEPTSITYQWLNGGVEIAGATSAAYTVVSAEQAKSLQCRVKASYGGVPDVVLTKPAEPSSALPSPPAPELPAITGTFTSGGTAKCETGTWSGGPTFTYQWLKSGAPIAGATNNTYVLQAGDIPSVLQCQVTGTNASGSVAAISPPHNTSPAPSKPPASAGPSEISVASSPGTPEVKDTTVTFPSGLSLSPSAAGGLEGCADAQFAVHSLAEASCPEGSQIGTVKITTPLLTSPLEGQLFLGQPECGETSPCTSEDAQDGKMFRLFIQAIDPAQGVVVKVQGTTSVNPSTGQVTASFDETPQLPFEVLELKLKNGPRAPLATPQTCGVAVTHSEFVPWSTGGLGGISGTEEIKGTPTATSEEPFTVDWDGKGGACPETLPFAPGFSAGTTSTAAAAKGSNALSVSLSREDREQDLGGIVLHTPEGLLGTVSELQLCGEPQAAQGTCGSASRIGSVTASAGPGTDPYSVTGSVYLTQSYKGAPFGLSIVVPTKAGPFNLGNVVVRGTVAVDPHTAELTVTSDPFPQILDGIPLRLRDVHVSVDREGFILNPSSCAAKQITATITGAPPVNNPGEPVKSSTLASSFDVGGCANLVFNPSFAVSTQGKTSRTDGASLTVKVGYPQGSEANIKYLKVELPKQLPSRLTTLQKACTAAQFEANPAGCPAASVLGTAVANTPVLSKPLIGPAYFVSHGGAAFPDLEIVLQGEGVTVVVDGATFISKQGITSTTFSTVPDAPISSFQVTLPEGPDSALAANGNLCTSKLVMPTTIIGQNGKEITQQTKIAVTGCPQVKKASLTRAQKLKAALKACKKDKSKSKRVTCEKQARKKYGPVKKKSKAKGKKKGK